VTESSLLSPDVIERYAENFDLQTDSRTNFRSL